MVDLVIIYAMTKAFVKYLETGEKPQTHGPSDFRHLIFKGVSGFKVQDRWIRDEKGEITYSDLATPALLLQEFDIEHRGKPWIKLVFESQTSVEFTFDELRVERRLGNYVRTTDQGTVVFMDGDTKEEFDRHKPFGE